VREGTTLVSTSTRNFPTPAEYFEVMGVVNKDGAAIYKYLNFNQIEE
jgi:aconitate hydratase 2/2-methylisocitrate dehydratase